MKQLAEALKITVELTVQEWNDFGLAVTHMVDVHVNRLPPAATLFEAIF